MKDPDFGKQVRINYIDFLKFIGLTAIIIAHVGSPDWLLMLRNFDVPLMVIVSSILGERSYKKYEGKGIAYTKDYYITRIKRLVIPTWMFLTFYFILAFLMGQKQSTEYYIYSYCLTRYGIGFVWIILIYLYSAMLIPLFSKIKFSVKGIIIIVTVYCLYELIYYFQVGVDNEFIETTLFYIVPYGLLTYLGYNFCRMSKKVKMIIAAAALLIFIIFGTFYWARSGAPQSVQIVKYPPRLYYLSYGIIWSFFLLMFCEKHDFRIYDNPIIRYISVHSLDLYLWHILVLSMYSTLGLPEIWYIKLAAVYVIALIIVFALNKILNLMHL